MQVQYCRENTVVLYCLSYSYYVGQDVVYLYPISRGYIRLLLSLTMTIKDDFKQDDAILKHTGWDHLYIAKPEEAKVS